MSTHPFIEEELEKLIALLEKQGVKEDGNDEAAHQIVDEQKSFLISSHSRLIERIKGEVQQEPKNWSNWSVERQLGFQASLTEVKALLDKYIQ